MLSIIKPYLNIFGLPGQTGRPGPIKSISGRAWAGTSAHGQARHGPLIFSCLSGSCLNGPCLAGPVPGRAGLPVWPPIVRNTRLQTGSGTQANYVGQYHAFDRYTQTAQRIFILCQNHQSLIRQPSFTDVTGSSST